MPNQASQHLHNQFVSQASNQQDFDRQQVVPKQQQNNFMLTNENAQWNNFINQDTGIPPTGNQNNHTGQS
jgi:hypothetical protein